MLVVSPWPWFGGRPGTLHAARTLTVVGGGPGRSSLRDRLGPMICDGLVPGGARVRGSVLCVECRSGAGSTSVPSTAAAVTEGQNGAAVDPDGASVRY